METSKTQWPKRVLAALVIIAFVVLFAMLLVAAFKIGMVTALAAAGATLVGYNMPTALLDWPRVTVEVLVAFVEALLDFFASVFL